MDLPKKPFQPKALEGQPDDPGVTPLTFTPLLALWTPGGPLTPKQLELHNILVLDRIGMTAEKGYIATLF